MNMSLESGSLILQSQSLISEQLKEKGYAFVEGKAISMPQSLKEAFTELSEAFGQLKKYRYPTMRYGVGGFNNRNMQELELIFKDGVFSINESRIVSSYRMKLEDHLTAQVARLYKNHVIQKLVELALKTFPDFNSAETYQVNVVLSRHEISVSHLVPHQDFCDWISQFNIHRSSEGIEGGVVKFSNLNGDGVVTDRLLTEPLDGYFLDDRRFRHSASPITISKVGAVRDVLIIRRHQPASS